MVDCAQAGDAAANARPAIQTTFMSRSPSRNGTVRIGSAHGKSNQIKGMAWRWRYRLWFWGTASTRRWRQARATKRGGRAAPSGFRETSGREIHLEFDRMRRHAEALHLLVLERDVRVEHVVGEDAAAREELAILVERFERFVERGARVRHFRGFFRLQVVQVLVERIAR